MADYYVCKDPNTVLTTIDITVGKVIQSKSFQPSTLALE